MSKKTKQKDIETKILPSVMAAALREMFNRLTDEEKRGIYNNFGLE